MKTFHRVFALIRTWPEGSDLIDVYGHKGDAEGEARKRNELIKRMKHDGIGDLVERLSHYTIVPKQIK